MFITGLLRGRIPQSNNREDHSMNTKRIRQLSAIGIVTLAVCALVVPALGSLKNPVTRPVKVKGTISAVVDTSTGLTMITEWGEATLVGRYSNTGWGFFDPSIPAFVAGGGTVVAADGSTIDWEMLVPNTPVYTGGTGRFQGITGGFVATPISQSTPVDNGDGTVTVVLTYVGSGEATY